MRISGNRAVQEQILSCRCSFLGHAEQPTPSHRREHVSAASAQVNGVIVASVVGNLDEIHNLDIYTPTATSAHETAASAGLRPLDRDQPVRQLLRW